MHFSKHLLGCVWGLAFVTASVGRATGVPGPQETLAPGATVSGPDQAKQIAAAETEAKAHPRDPQVLLRLATLYQQQSDFNKSVPLLERLVLIQPQNFDAYRLLGIDQFHSGHPADALGPLRQVVDANPRDGEANFYLGLSYLALDRDDEANKAFDRVATTAPANLDEVYFLIKGYSRLSSAMLTKLFDLGGENSYRMHEVRGEYFDLDNAPEQATQEYEKAVQLRPDLPSLHYVLGNSYWKRSQLDKAVTEFRWTIELAPSHFMAHYKLAMVLMEQNDPAHALKEFQTALAEQPGLVDGYWGVGKALYQQGQYEAALPQLQHYVELSPDSPEPHYLLFQIFRRMNNNEQAERELALFKQKEEKAKAKNAARVTPPGN
jgi:tetratricopeptide (TPR) repeat protein